MLLKDYHMDTVNTIAKRVITHGNLYKHHPNRPPTLAKEGSKENLKEPQAELRLRQQYHHER